MSFSRRRLGAAYYRPLSGRCRWCQLDGAATSLPDHQIRKYVAIQQWFAEKHPVPFYSCIFDNAITDCYSWIISKDGYFIFGGAYPMKDGQTRFTALKEKNECLSVPVW